MHPEPSRRDFLRLTAGWAAGFGAATVLGGGVVPGAARRRGLLPGAGSPSRGETGGGGPAAGSGSALPPRVIGLRTLGGDFRFDPVGLRISTGDEVLWLNMGDFHTASAFHPANAELLDGDVPLRIPRDAEAFHSGMLGMSGGAEFAYSPWAEGVYDYFCQPHYSFGMVGRFIVGEPRGGPAVTRPLSELNDAAMEAMPSVEAIMGPAGRAFEWTSRLNGLLYLRASDGDGTPAAEALEGGVAGDDELASVLKISGESGRFWRALSRFLEAYAAGRGYETLVALADEAKAPLRAASAASS